MLLVIFALIVPTYSATVAVRNSQDTVGGRLAAAGKRIAESFRGPGDVEIEAVGRMIRWNPRLTPLVDRTGQIWFFQMVYDRSPIPVPYWGGHTYKPIFTSFIPRATI